MTEFIADLEKAGTKVVPMARVGLEQYALRSKKNMAAAFSGHRRFMAVPKAVDYDLRGLSAEVGVNKRKRQGALANILAYGTSTLPPVVDHAKGFDREAASFQAYLQTQMGGLL